MLIESLTASEARVLGTLLEKHLATPDYYPMTLNALRNACNQKSSREPVTEYSDETISEALAGLKRKTLVAFVPYGSQGNQYKYRHFLEDPRFNLHKKDLAVLAVLLLRGSQTLNEIRTRATSLHPLAGLEETDAVLTALASRPEPLAEKVARRPGWKEPRWQDLLREQLPLEGQGNLEDTEEPSPSLPPPGAVRTQPRREDLEDLKSEVAGLKAQVAGFEARLAALQETVAKISSELF